MLTVTVQNGAVTWHSEKLDFPERPRLLILSADAMLHSVPLLDYAAAAAAAALECDPLFGRAR